MQKSWWNLQESMDLPVYFSQSNWFWFPLKLSLGWFWRCCCCSRITSRLTVVALATLTPKGLLSLTLLSHNGLTIQAAAVSGVIREICDWKRHWNRSARVSPRMRSSATTFELWPHDPFPYRSLLKRYAVSSTERQQCSSLTCRGAFFNPTFDLLQYTLIIEANKNWLANLPIFFNFTRFMVFYQVRVSFYLMC